jgi:hypothetical protein
MEEEVNEELIRSLVAGFKDGSWPGKEFRHLHHLVVAVHYIAEEADPLGALRVDIRRYNVSQGGENTEDRGYHETITRFWVEIVRDYAAGLPPGLSRTEVTNRVVEAFATQRDLFREYYDFDVLASREARANWIPPNQTPPGTTSIFPTPSE